MRAPDSSDLLRNFYRVNAAHSSVTRLVLLDEANAQVDRLTERFSELFGCDPPPTGVREFTVCYHH